MNYRSLAKLFNSSEINKFAQGDLSTINASKIQFPELSECENFFELYNKAYSILLKKYRNEYVVKNEIVNKILLGRHSMNTTTMLSELRTGNNIADCVIINKESVCYEIKTEFDSLIRFKDQLNSYLKTYDKTFVVTHKSHLPHILAMHKATPYFGIIELTSRNQLKKIVDAQTNLCFDFGATFDTLRKPEYMYIAEIVSGAIPEMPNTQLYKYCKDVYFSLNPSRANDLFKYGLKNFRKNDNSFINMLPKSLKNIGISYKINRKHKNNILCSFKRKIR